MSVTIYLHLSGIYSYSWRFLAWRHISYNEVLLDGVLLTLIRSTYHVQRRHFLQGISGLAGFMSVSPSNLLPTLILNLAWKIAAKYTSGKGKKKGILLQGKCICQMWFLHYLKVHFWKCILLSHYTYSKLSEFNSFIGIINWNPDMCNIGDVSLPDLVINLFYWKLKIQ